MIEHETYMRRCLQLAKLAAGYVAPNPMVGAVLVHGDRIIGEGYHQQFGEPHAEVNCINSVREEDKQLIQQSTLYVSLEPCAHYGKTPPCADLIIQQQIPKVVVGCRDPFEQVNRKGIEKLRNAGVKVVANVLEGECKTLNKRFFTFYTRLRPYVILKWAQSKNGCIANGDLSRVQISNAIANRLVHKWRSEEAAILVGTNTALHDNPALNVRYWQGNNPVRLILDLNLRLPHNLQVFDKSQKTIMFNMHKHEAYDNLLYYRLPATQAVAQEILQACYQLNIQSILVEGGTKLLQLFIDANEWDEARVIENTSLILNDGYKAPVLANSQLGSTQRILTDTVSFYRQASHD